MKLVRAWLVPLTLVDWRDHHRDRGGFGHGLVADRHRPGLSRFPSPIVRPVATAPQPDGRRERAKTSSRSPNR